MYCVFLHAVIVHQLADNVFIGLFLQVDGGVALSLRACTVAVAIVDEIGSKSKIVCAKRNGQSLPKTWITSQIQIQNFQNAHLSVPSLRSLLFGYPLGTSLL